MEQMSLLVKHNQMAPTLSRRVLVDSQLIREVLHYTRGQGRVEGGVAHCRDSIRQGLVNVHIIDAVFELITIVSDLSVFQHPTYWKKVV